jgi:hypothetical protein
MRVAAPNVSSADNLRAGQRVEGKLRAGITVSHRRKWRARRLASRAWFGLGLGGVMQVMKWAVMEGTTGSVSRVRIRDKHPAREDEPNPGAADGSGSK